jgi:2-polyprenyl-6-hydroxyphenyl methylase/3-demethylubiquinone-9 3-methyltransferase
MNCVICLGELKLLGSVGFDRNNADIPVINSTEVHYYKCAECNFVCAPEMLSWSTEKLGREVYNEDYIKYDPDYIETRPKNYSKFLLNNIRSSSVQKIKHLDYGSGLGVLSAELIKNKWNSTSYDPFSNPVKPPGRFNFITAIEVFEHSNNIDTTIKDIKSLLENNGVVLFSTLLANSATTIDWWYIGARNGHIGILSEKSLKIVATRNNLFFSSISDGLHILQSQRSNKKDVLGW